MPPRAPQRTSTRPSPTSKRGNDLEEAPLRAAYTMCLRVASSCVVREILRRCVSRIDRRRPGEGAPNGLRKGRPAPQLEGVEGCPPSAWERSGNRSVNRGGFGWADAYIGRRVRSLAGEPHTVRAPHRAAGGAKHSGTTTCSTSRQESRREVRSQELTNLLPSARPRTAPGPDGIPYQLWQVEAQSAAQTLTSVLHALAAGARPPPGFNHHPRRRGGNVGGWAAAPRRAATVPRRAAASATAALVVVVVVRGRCGVGGVGGCGGGGIAGGYRPVPSS